MKNVVGFGEFRAFSNYDSPNRNRGHVVFYRTGTTEPIREWFGNQNNKIGEYMWISKGTEDGSDCGFSSCSNNLIFAFTSRQPEIDELYHINFYSVVEHRDGSYHVFDYKRDAIRVDFDEIIEGKTSRE